MAVTTKTAIPPRRSDISPYRWRLSVFAGKRFDEQPLFSERGFFTQEQAMRHAVIMLCRFNDVAHFLVEITREEENATGSKTEQVP